ncbi:MAG: STAS domain-containing protein [Ruminococcaceae bacterium]|nr:STAS domain-containing protein [Oscillospiraceae bacterium]
MNFSSKKEGNTLTVSVSGRIDTNSAPELEKHITDNLDGITELILDLKDITYTSSAGLRVFLKAQKLMNKQGVMTLKNVREEVMDIFELTGFSGILNIE